MFASFVSQLLERRGIHYSWVIAAVTFLAMLTTSAALGLPGAMLQPLSREFGWSTSEISSALALRFMLFGLIGPFAAVLMERYGLSLETTPPADDIDRAIALASGEALEDIALRSGAIYWAGSLASVIAGRQAAALQAALGADAYAFALANRDLTGPLRPIGPLEDVHGLVYADGLRCLGAWGQSLSGDTGMRVRLKLMPHALIDQKADEAFVKTGPAIVRRAMGP